MENMEMITNLSGKTGNLFILPKHIILYSQVVKPLILKIKDIALSGPNLYLWELDMSV